MARKPLWRRKLEGYEQNGQHVPGWLDDLRDEFRPEDCIKTYANGVRQYFQRAERHGWCVRPADITAGDMMTFYEQLKREGLASNTHQMYLCATRQFCVWCGADRLKVVRFGIKPERENVDWLSEQEVAMAIATAERPQLRAMMVLFSYTGMRREELASLRMSNLRPDHVVVTGKFRKTRRIPLVPEAMDEMAAYIEWRRGKQHPLFLLYEHGGLSGYDKTSITKALNAHGRSLGMHLSPHTLRRSFGRHYILNGGTLPVLSKIYGHKSVEQTMQYIGLEDAHVSSEAMRCVVRYNVKGYTK